MTGFMLLLGHLIGDYVVQNDFLAKWKTNPDPTPEEAADAGHPYMLPEERDMFLFRRSLKASVACTVHCICYTLAVWACSFWWMPWWGLVACFAIHWPIDRFRLAGRWMRNVSGQNAFATGPLSPWSIIVVDNTAHLATLAAIAFVAGVR